MNAGFNAATDIFGMGAKWAVQTDAMNASGSTAECSDNNNDITHRDQYGSRIAPSAEYTLKADFGEGDDLPALGTIVTIDGKKVMIATITVKTAGGNAPTASVTGVQVENGAATGRTYACGVQSLSTRHKAQDIMGFIAAAQVSTLTDSTFTFSVTPTISDPKGVIESSDCTGGKIVAQYSHASGTGTAAAAPTVSGATRVVSAPVSKADPENGYTTTAYSVTDSLTGSEE